MNKMNRTERKTKLAAKIATLTAAYAAEPTHDNQLALYAARRELRQMDKYDALMAKPRHGFGAIFN